jgi:phage terminase Nu1 subunit (DNA packaging protein)
MTERPQETPPRIGPEPYLMRAEIARFMRVSTRTIDRWVLEGCPHETWGLRTKKFRPSEVIAWARLRSSKGDST